MRISKESIFTGLNNPKIVSITDDTYAEYFGFTAKETEDLLKFYDRESFMDTVREWYDGYLFGETEVYNPWSVINYVKQIWANPKAFPQPFWANTSSNSIVRTLVEGADIRVKQEIESLIEGEAIEKPVHEDILESIPLWREEHAKSEEITYEDIEPGKPGENLWNFLFFTGYLKKVKERMEGNVHYISMTIPNEEVRYIYKNTVLAWFDSCVRKKDFSAFYKSIIGGDADLFEKTVTGMLREGISFYDSKEAFYHGFLMGLLGGMEDYYAYSNREAGDGRYDICLKSLDVERPVIIMELKLAASYKNMDVKCNEALAQIELKRYKDDLIRDGYEHVLCYGVAFFKKNCRIALAARTL